MNNEMASGGCGVETRPEEPMIFSVGTEELIVGSGGLGEVERDRFTMR